MAKATGARIAARARLKRDIVMRLDIYWRRVWRVKRSKLMTCSWKPTRACRKRVVGVKTPKESNERLLCSKNDWATKTRTTVVREGRKGMRSGRKRVYEKDRLACASLCPFGRVEPSNPWGPLASPLAVRRVISWRQILVRHVKRISIRPGLGPAQYLAAMMSTSQCDSSAVS